MADDPILVSWRDIPAQVLRGKGRTAERAGLSPRFEAAIDRAAMRAGMTGTDAYLGEWRRTPVPGGGAPQALAARIEADFDDERLRRLIAGDGWDRPQPGAGDAA